MNLLKILGALFIVNCIPAALLAQFTLESTVPADGATNILSPATFDLTFSAALDTSVNFDDFFLDIEVFPDDSLGEPDIELSPDLKTVTISGLVLAQDTRYSFVILNARSQTGESLARPYVITVTTGNSLPSGSVAGEVFPPEGNESGIALVGLFEDAFGEDPAYIGVAASPYTITYVPDGIYLPFSVMDTNGDGDIDPSSGDAAGFYDANGDGEPNTIEISGGGAVTGIDIQLVLPAPGKAKDRFADVQQMADGWAQDAALVAIHSDEVTPAGEAFGWYYVYYSETLQGFHAYSIFGDMVNEEEYRGEEPPETLALPESWVDSDVAANVAESNGGSEFRNDFDDAEVNANLHYFYLYGNEDSSSSNGQTTLQPSMRANAVRQNSNIAIWNFQYWSESNNKFMEIPVDAESGNLLASDARSNMSAAEVEASQWQQDAYLIAVRSEANLMLDGRSPAWAYIYYSQEADSAVAFVAASGKVLTVQPEEKQHLSQEALPQQFCNSTDAAPIAAQASENFRNAHPDVYFFAELVREHENDSLYTIWRFNYHTLSEEWLQVRIDAGSCEVIVKVGDSPVTQRDFVLRQNYPNPFNPATDIKYQTATTAHVEVAVYNMLGQKIKTLVNQLQPAGAYTLKWDGTDSNGKAVPSGLYIYYLKTGNFTQSKKMLLLR